MSAPEIVEVQLTGITDCDLCADHYVWNCPRCERGHDHYQEVDFPLDEKCSCGVTMRITADEAKRWRQMFGLEDA